MPKSDAIEIMAADANLCGEAPIWDAAQQRLLWADIPNALVYELAADGKKQIISRDLTVSGIGLNRAGGLVFCGRGDRGGVHLWRGPEEFRNILSMHENVKLSCNDMIVDASGRMYVGTLHWGANGRERLGELYLIGGDGSIRLVDDGIELANGLGFSPDNRTLYFADSTARQIYAYDVHPISGELFRKRSFVRIPPHEGIPDGLTVDAEGFVWSAQWYGAQVVRYDPDGTVERRIKLPVTQITNVAFGGKDLNELYITSAAGGWKGPYAPPGFDFVAGNWGGSLYRVKTDIQGKPEHPAALVW